MLISKAKARYIRVSPRKLRGVIDLIRGEKVGQALEILTNINKRARIFVEKALRSALSNARRNPLVKPEELFISKITADAGPMMKRYRAAAMGRATMIRRRSAHLTIELSKAEEKQVEKKRAKPARSPARKIPRKGTKKQ